jgi:hypothetical protein
LSEGGIVLSETQAVFGEQSMAWHLAVTHFFGGVFLANTLPHLVAGVCGQPLPTPFASPPFKGLSSPTVNVAWALLNLALSYLLLVQVGALEIQNGSQAALCFAGFALMALQCSRSLGKIRSTTLS